MPLGNARIHLLSRRLNSEKGNTEFKVAVPSFNLTLLYILFVTDGFRIYIYIYTYIYI